MEKANETKKVIPACSNDMLNDFLPDLCMKLEECQKSLEHYLETKRKKFPRFFFLSEPNILNILSHGSDPKAIEDEYSKLFIDVSNVTFDKTAKGKGKS